MEDSKKPKDKIQEELHELRQRVAELESSEKSSRARLESSPVCTKIVGLDFNLRYMSSAGIRDLNIDDITTFYGKPYPLDFFPESFKVTMLANLKKVKETNDIITQEASVGDVYGAALWFQSTLVPVDIKNKNGFIMVISINTTDRKNAEIALNGKLEQLQIINSLMVGQESKMRELKQEINKLYDELKRPHPYSA